MARKPYHHAQPDDWYKANCTYRWYMLRELTSITTAIAAFNLFYGFGKQRSCLAWLDALSAQSADAAHQHHCHRWLAAQQQNLV